VFFGRFAVFRCGFEVRSRGAVSRPRCRGWRRLFQPVMSSARGRGGRPAVAVAGVGAVRCGDLGEVAGLDTEVGLTPLSLRRL